MPTIFHYGVLLTPVADRRNDFDGDGQSDPALYDPVSGLWASVFPAATMRSAQRCWGARGFLRFRDFDGDGLADPSVYDASTPPFTWLFQVVIMPLIPLTGFGGLGFEPVNADLDGDGQGGPHGLQRRVRDMALSAINPNYVPEG